MSSHDTQRGTALYDAHTRAGATFTDFAGWQMPVRYSSDLAEHHAVRTAAGLFDLSHMGEIVLIGPEAGQALDYALAGTLTSLALGQAKYSILLSPAGGVLDDVVVYRTGDSRYLVVANAANRKTVVEELRDRTAPFDVEVYDESDDIALIAVQGPTALSIMLATHGFHIAGDDFAQRITELTYYWSVPAEFETHPVLIARTGYTGEDGFELYLAPGSARALWDALLVAGSAQGLVPAGLASRDTLRLEAGMPLYGHELSSDTMPVQAGLGRVVDLATGTDFVGRVASEYGPDAEARVLVGLVGQGKRAARAGYPVVAVTTDGADERVGVVTSGALSPTIGVPIAMAYVVPRYASPGTVLHVDVRGTRLPFTVTALPFYRRKKPAPSRKDG